MHARVESIQGRMIWEGDLPLIRDAGFHLFHDGTTWETVSTKVLLKRTGLAIQSIKVKEL